MEVSFRFLLRPYFMALLAQNPKAGGARERKAAATQMLPRAVCFVHNVVQIALALAVLADPAFRADVMFRASPLSRLVMLVSAGYFFYDALECVWRYEHEGPEFLLHGVMCFLTYAQLYRSGQMHWLGAGFLMWELSTPFMHARWFLYKIGRDKSAAYPAVALAGMAVFFLCRICFGPWLSWRYLAESSAALATPRGRRELWMPAIWYFRLNVVVLNSLNAFWFSKMVKMLAHAMQSGGGEEKKEGGGGSKKKTDGGKAAAAAARPGGRRAVDVTASAAPTPTRRGSSRALAGQA
jgi:hypothetical protein